MQDAAENIIPSTVELGGKSPNVFFAEVMDQNDAFLDKAIEGLVLYAFNKGEVCTCPSRALIQESIYDTFMAALPPPDRAGAPGQPARSDHMLGPQNSAQQLDNIAGYVDIGRQEGAELPDRRRAGRPRRRARTATSSSRPCSRATTSTRISSWKIRILLWPLSTVGSKK